MTYVVSRCSGSRRSVQPWWCLKVTIAAYLPRQALESLSPLFLGCLGISIDRDAASPILNGSVLPTIQGHHALDRT